MKIRNLLVRSDDGENGVAHATAHLQDVVLAALFLYAEQLGELGEQPVSVLEELVVMD